MSRGAGTTIGRRFRAERERLGLSRQALADLNGCGYHGVYCVEKGSSQPGTKLLTALVKGGGSAEYVLTGERPTSTPIQCFLNRVHVEILAARRKFPKPEASMTALTEEVGELAKALLDEPWENVVQEAHQVAAMAARVALEGDPTLKSYRVSRGADES